MQAKDVMTAQVVTVSPDTTVTDVANLLLGHHISGVPVVDKDNRVLGMVSEGDLLRRPETGTERSRSWWLEILADSGERAREFIKTHGATAVEVMSKPAVTVEENAELAEVAQILEEKRVKRLPVVRDGKLVGLVSRADLLRGLAARQPAPASATRADDRSLREAVMKALSVQDWFSSTRMNVVVEDGTVHLWGLVNSADERKALTLAVREVPGVTSVEDHTGQVPPWVWGS